jgi:hypothetical protein
LELFKIFICICLLFYFCHLHTSSCVWILYPVKSELRERLRLWDLRGIEREASDCRSSILPFYPHSLLISILIDFTIILYFLYSITFLLSCLSNILFIVVSWLFSFEFNSSIIPTSFSILNFNPVIFYAKLMLKTIIFSILRHWYIVKLMES